MGTYVSGNEATVTGYPGGRDPFHENPRSLVKSARKGCNLCRYILSVLGWELLEPWERKNCRNSPVTMEFGSGTVKNRVYYVDLRLQGLSPIQYWRFRLDIFTEDGLTGFLSSANFVRS